MAIGPGPRTPFPPARMQAYLEPPGLKGLAGFTAQASDFPEDSAAFPIRISVFSMAIAGGTDSSHCRATGAFPGGASRRMENWPFILLSALEGGTRKDWPSSRIAATDR